MQAKNIINYILYVIKYTLNIGCRNSLVSAHIIFPWKTEGSLINGFIFWHWFLWDRSFGLLDKYQHDAFYRTLMAIDSVQDGCFWGVQNSRRVVRQTGEEHRSAPVRLLSLQSLCVPAISIGQPGTSTRAPWQGSVVLQMARDWCSACSLRLQWIWLKPLRRDRHWSRVGTSEHTN